MALSGAGAALAQDSGVSVSVGVRAWRAEWSTFGYFPDPNDPLVNLALTQEPANSKLVLMPVVGVRYGEFSASISAMPSTDFSFVSGGGNRRQELDLNLGYDVIPGLTLTLGYKKVSQTDRVDGSRYRPSGPVAGLSGNASLSGPWSLYGSLGVGKFKTPAGDSIDFKADYRLTELGLAYALYGNQFVKRWTFTAGYRIQVLTSKDAFVAPNGGSQDGVDTTQGFTLGAIATF
jgi:hypothetical protein